MRTLTIEESRALDNLTDEWRTADQIGARTFTLWTLCSPELGLAEEHSLTRRDADGTVIGQELTFRRKQNDGTSR